MATEVFIGLGSNLGHPEHQLTRALAWLDDLPGTRVEGVSPLYRTAPVGPADQPDFLNAVALLATRMAADELLHALQALEQQAGRQRTRHWGERTLDLDILLYGDITLDERALTVPHPRLRERAFVLVPLHDLAPDLVFPDGSTLVSALAACNRDGVCYHGEADWRATP